MLTKCNYSFRNLFIYSFCFIREIHLILKKWSKTYIIYLLFIQKFILLNHWGKRLLFLVAKFAWILIYLFLYIFYLRPMVYQFTQLLFYIFILFFIYIFQCIHSYKGGLHNDTNTKIFNKSISISLTHLLNLKIYALYLILLLVSLLLIN